MRFRSNSVVILTVFTPDWRGCAARWKLRSNCTPTPKSQTPNPKPSTNCKGSIPPTHTKTKNKKTGVTVHKTPVTVLFLSRAGNDPTALADLLGAAT